MSFVKLYLDVKKYMITFFDLESLGRMCQVSKEMKDLICNENKDLRVEVYIKGSSHCHIESRSLDHSADSIIHSDLEDLFLKCCKKGGPIVVIGYLIRNKNIDPSTRYNYAIRWASKNGRTEVVKVLLSDPRVDPSADNNHAIRRASKNGHTEVVKALLSDPRVDPSDKKM